jgi:hypothetical protein
MRERLAPLPLPPERDPYFRTTAPGERIVVLRCPSMPVLGGLVRSIGRERQAQLFGVLELAAEGKRSLLQMVLAAEHVLPLLAALVGIAWVDPVLELETEREPDEDIGAYGARVYEELHEAGWAVPHVVLAGIHIAERAGQASEIEAEVLARLSFFRRPKASPSEPASPSRPTTSEDTEGEPSTN